MPDVLEVELLRRGPQHNQLLSPLTDYWGSCMDGEVGFVSEPFEHRAFRQLLEPLQYRVADASEKEANERTRLDTLKSVGDALAALLRQLPGFEEDPLAGKDILKIVLSGAELDMLPFELAPTGLAHPEVTVLRALRCVGPSKVAWDTDPSVLMIVGPLGKEESTRPEHEAALERALRPWRKGHKAPRILVEPTLSEVEATCRRRAFTHIHILAHGNVVQRGLDRYVSLNLSEDNNSGNGVRGCELADALCAGRRLPNVVTLASCQSAHQPDVTLADGHPALELHERGVAFVVASQFRLTAPGSTRFVDRFYAAVLSGEDPRTALAACRRELQQDQPGDHDWASLVGYEALPAGFELALANLRYAYVRRCIDAHLRELDDAQAGNPSRAASREAIAHFVAALPAGPEYRLRNAVLTGGCRKREAQAWFLEDNVKASVRELRRALACYEEAWKLALRLEPVYPPAPDLTLHWIASQVLSLRCALGMAFEPTIWGVLRMSADQADVVPAAARELEPSLRQRAWSACDRVEGWLIQLAYASSDSETRKLRGEVDNAARAALRAVSAVPPNKHDFDPRAITARQLRRYPNWWGKPAFLQALGPRESLRIEALCRYAKALGDRFDPPSAAVVRKATRLKGAPRTALARKARAKR